METLTSCPSSTESEIECAEIAIIANPEKPHLALPLPSYAARLYDVERLNFVR